MDIRELINHLASRFEEKKPRFLADVHGAVSGYVADQKAGCLTLIEKTSSGQKEWRLSASPAYVSRLVSFCRGTNYRGNALDSGLTEPVVSIVSDQFERLYQSNSEEISQAVLAYVLQDKVLSDTLLQTLIGSGSATMVSDTVKEKAVAVLLNQMKEIMKTAGAKALAGTLGKVVVATVSKPLGMHLAALLLKAISLKLKLVIAKVLTTAALKTLIASAVKKFLIAAIAAVIVKAVAAKFGITTAAAFTLILIPIIVVYITYEIATFPRHLAEKVAGKIVDDLRGSYGSINEDVFQRIVNEVLAAGVGGLAKDLAQSREVQDAIAEFLGAIQ